jgi:hypothetical protein
MALGLPVFAGQKFDYPQGAPIFSITYPETWTVEAQEQTIAAGTDDGGVSSVLMALDAQDLDSALQASVDALGENFTGFETDGEAQEGEVNGMAVVLVNGIGTVDGGGKVKVNCAIFTPDAEKFFMLFIFTPEGVAGQQAEEINSLLQSITKE